MKKNSISRRTFLKSSALAGAAGMVGTGSALTSCNGIGGGSNAANKPLKEPGTYYIPELPDMANDGRELKAGVIGCGGRGSGAAFNWLSAANGVTITAVADTFKDRADGLADKLKEKGIDIPENMRFAGLDAYKQVIDSGVDVVIVATPPNFRPIHFQYATEKGKHSFLEKPICVDPVGYRSIVVTARQAQAKNLCVVTGTQRHHQRSYVAAYQKVMEGAIGEITGGVVYWNGGKLWHKDHQPGWTDCEWMIKDWVNWEWLSGDHIVEQHVHNLDVFTWFSGLKPVSALGFGSRQRRVTGDQFDNFSVDFTMENGIHLHSMCRQIDGCDGHTSEFIQGTKGSLNTLRETVIKDLAGNVVWKYDSEAEKAEFKQRDAYVLEHVNWINHIRTGKPIEQASETAIPNMAAIMGRESAYTGRESTWDAMTASPLDLMPKDVNLTGKMDMSGFVVPIAGKAYVKQ
jgi:predicted dehydrogenase